MDTKERLRKLRKARGITAKKMAEALGLKTVGAYYKKECGMNKITVEEAKIIASVLGVSMDETFAGEKHGK